MVTMVSWLLSRSHGRGNLDGGDSSHLVSAALTSALLCECLRLPRSYGVHGNTLQGLKTARPDLCYGSLGDGDSLVSVVTTSFAYPS